MGQYWKVVNLDKREWVDAHQLGVGLKLGEQIGSGHGTPDALFILVAAMRGRRGGGDFDYDSNYYGRERDMTKETHRLRGAPVVEEYNDVAKRTIGRWAGDRIAVVGDYAEDDDLANFKITNEKGEFGASAIYGMCIDHDTDAAGIASTNEEYGTFFKDITPDVARVIEHECGGKFVGDGWKQFIRHHGDVWRWKGTKPDHYRQTGKVTDISDTSITVEWSDGTKIERKTYSVANPVEWFAAV